MQIKNTWCNIHQITYGFAVVIWEAVTITSSSTALTPGSSMREAIFWRGISIAQPFNTLEYTYLFDPPLPSANFSHLLRRPWVSLSARPELSSSFSRVTMTVTLLSEVWIVWKNTYHIILYMRLVRRVFQILCTSCESTSYKCKEWEGNNVPLFPLPGTRPLDRKLLDLMKGSMTPSSMAAADSVSNDKGTMNFMVLFEWYLQWIVDRCRLLLTEIMRVCCGDVSLRLCLNLEKALRWCFDSVQMFFFLVTHDNSQVKVNLEKVALDEVSMYLGRCVFATKS